MTFGALRGLLDEGTNISLYGTDKNALLLANSKDNIPKKYDDFHVLKISGTAYTYPEIKVTVVGKGR